MGKGNPEKTQTEGQKKTGRISHRFTRDERIRKRSAFIQVYTRGRRFARPYFTGLYLRTDFGPETAWKRPARLGMSVGKKIGNSVIRNRLKRRIREVFRLHKHLLQPGYDIVINPKKGCETTDYAGLEKSMLDFFQAAGLMRSPDTRSGTNLS